MGLGSFGTAGAWFGTACLGTSRGAEEHEVLEGTLEHKVKTGLVAVEQRHLG